MTVKNYLWVLPFGSFLGGYLLMQHLMHIDTIKTPALVGKTIEQALGIISEHNLNVRLLAQKEEPDLPIGTILNQTPSAGQKIKPHQSIFLVVSTHPPVNSAPDVINISIDDITNLLADTNIRIRIYHLPSSYPCNHCFAQSPAPHEPLEHSQLLLYISAGNAKPIIWPNFTDKKVNTVTEFLDAHHIQSQIVHTTPHKQPHTCTTCQITEQRPLAGTLITLDDTKPLSVQLRVQ